MTYNKYLTDGIQDGTIQRRVVDGCTVYSVRRPKDAEEVVGYESSDCFVQPTPTEVAARECGDEG